MQINEREPTRQELSDLKSDNSYGFKLMELKNREATPAQIVQHLQSIVRELQSDHRRGVRKSDSQDSVDIAFGLGAVWGNQLVREFAWEWVCLEVGGGEFLVVASPDRAMFIGPAQFIKQCFDSPETECQTILYSFNVIASGATVAPGTYANVMSSIKLPSANLPG